MATGTSCVVAHCRYNRDYSNETPNPEGLTFYKFPDPNLSDYQHAKVQRVTWIEFVRVSLGLDPKDNSSWTPGPAAKICSSHFIRNRMSSDPNKSNFVPTIYPEGLEVSPRPVTYDLKDLLCLWVKNGSSTFPTLFPVAETESSQSNNPKIRSLTLTEIDVTSEPNPFVKSFIRVNSDMSFRACLRNKQVPINALLGENETTPFIGSVLEFQTILQKLLLLNLCIGITTNGLSNRVRDEGTLIKAYIDGKEAERLVSHDCEVIAPIKVCSSCKKLWRRVIRIKGDKIELTPEEQVQRMGQIVENYKNEVCRLAERNLGLKRRVGELEGILKERGVEIEGTELSDDDEVVEVKRRRVGDGDVGWIEVIAEGVVKKERVGAKKGIVIKKVEGCVGSGPVEKVAETPIQSQPSHSQNPAQQEVIVNQQATRTPKSTVGGNSGQSKKLPVPPAQSPVNPNLSLVAPSKPNSTQLKSEATPAPKPNSVGVNSGQSKVVPGLPAQSPANPNLIPTPAKPNPILTTPPSTSTPPPPKKILKISKEQALLLKNLTSTTGSGNVLRVNASQLESVNKILGRKPDQKPKPTDIPTSGATDESDEPPKKVVITVVKK